MLRSVVKFSIVFFQCLFKLVSFIKGVCCAENVVNIADVYLGFSYYSFKYSVFAVGHVEIWNSKT